MAAGGEEAKVRAGCEDGDDLYAVLGLKKECSAADLRNAYKKLALRWHPDRCSATASSKCVEEAKTRFQCIQEAYSVLSDSNKRFLYDVGVYDSDEDANVSAH
uniref:DnaJ subfamily B member 6 n=1 Tax=Anthurium amnicola TaxID=1678845 RepID=A0A1D1Y237_9ARAE